MDKNSENPVPGDVDKPSEDELSYIKGDFVPVSPRAKARSSSPRRRAHRQPIHIRVNMTDTQLKKLTDTLASPRSLGQLFNRPARHHAHHSDPITPSNNPNQVINGSVSSLDKPLPKSHPYHHETQTLHGHLAEDVAPSFSHPRLGSLSPDKELSSYQSHATLAERRHQSPPSRLVVEHPRPYEISSSERIMPAQMNPEPSTPKGRTAATAEYEWDSESVYSGDGSAEACVSPLKVPPKRDGRIDSGMNDNPILQGYCTWKHSSPQVENAANPPIFEQFHAESSGANPGAGEDSVGKIMTPPRVALYSPLTPFFAYKGAPVNKKGSKTMFGQNGWLEKTGQPPEKKKNPQKHSMLEGLKRMAKDLTTYSRRSRAEDKYTKMYSSVVISLDPREQSLLYCELEFYLSCAIHGYITVQLNHGRLDADKLKRITDAWSQKGRPKVMGFRFDLETQVELIGLHIGEFRFYGRRQGNEGQISGLLHTMKVNARAMRIHTFCQPDSVIAKQLVDAQSFFNLLGVPDVQQLALQHVAQFFKVIVEREQNKSTRHERDRTQAVSSLVGFQWEGGSRS